MNFSRLMRLRVLSMQVSGPIGVIEQAIVDPNTLKIVAFVLQGDGLGTADTGNILDVRSIREISSFGIIIDSTDELVLPGDVIKIDELASLHFNPVGLKVITKKSKTRLGKVSDWTLTTDNLSLVQIIVQRTLLKSFMDPELTIARSEIVEVTDYEIIVKGDEKSLLEKSAADPNFVPNFVNPFREPDFVKADNQSPDE